jgi:hypothetical protein
MGHYVADTAGADNNDSRHRNLLLFRFKSGSHNRDCDKKQWIFSTTGHLRWSAIPVKVLSEITTLKTLSK